MNYYERHIGDYARDTGHLSILEHGVYTLLLDRYYATEAPIPADQAHRIARARSKEEVKAVDVVLSEFFLLVDGQWSHRRCSEEIEKARVRIGNAKANGTKGGRPRKGNPEKPSGLSMGSENETQTKPLQAPDSIHQSVIGNSTEDGESAKPPNSDRPTLAAEACIRMKTAGVFPVNPQHAELLAAIDAGATPDEFAATAAELVSAGKPAHMTYIVRAVMGRRESARARASPLGRPSVSDSFANRTYTGTPDDELPEHLRPAA